MIPQLDTTWFVSQIFWALILFSISLVISYNLLVPRIRTSISARKHFMDDLENNVKLISTQITKLKNEFDTKKQLLDDETQSKMNEIYEEQIKQYDAKIRHADTINQDKFECMKSDLEKWKNDFLHDVDGELDGLSEKVKGKVCQ